MTDNSTTTTDSTKNVATGGDTTTVDLQDLVDDLEDEAQELRETKERIEAGDEDADEDAEFPPEWAGVEAPVRRIEHSIDLVRSDIDRFGGSEFVIKKARAGEVARAMDMVAETSLETETDIRAQVANTKHAEVQVCVEQAPPEAPARADGRLNTMDFEEPTFERLHQAIENFNAYGQVSLEDF